MTVDEINDEIDGKQDCGLTYDQVAEHVQQAWRDGYDAGLKAPRGITNPCPGSGLAPRRITRYYPGLNDSPGQPYRGICGACGNEYNVTSGFPKIRKHQRKT